MTRKVRTIRILRALAIAAGAAFLYAGLSRGEADIVLRKAMYICLECIGVAG